ncbi:uncharacterized protein LOC132378560 isoform X2 [Hypanus sabinus]|uniref:uncharacterized protein LOC132378560 isoform X2 n=1 Tax=Hypanus sabinus TaxID=79690 RepID=UPI0028C3F209|nr:uncharacterized protein LOC132378560 isoform X2 [Hypanus sabinus]
MPLTEASQENMEHREQWLAAGVVCLDSSTFMVPTFQAQSSEKAMEQTSNIVNQELHCEAQMFWFRHPGETEQAFFFHDTAFLQTPVARNRDQIIRQCIKTASANNTATGDILKMVQGSTSFTNVFFLPNVVLILLEPVIYSLMVCFRAD